MSTIIISSQKQPVSFFDAISFISMEIYTITYFDTQSISPLDFS